MQDDKIDWAEALRQARASKPTPCRPVDCPHIQDRIPLCECDQCAAQAA